MCSHCRAQSSGVPPPTLSASWPAHTSLRQDQALPEHMNSQCPARACPQLRLHKCMDTRLERRLPPFQGCWALKQRCRPRGSSKFSPNLSPHRMSPLQEGVETPTLRVTHRQTFQKKPVCTGPPLRADWPAFVERMQCGLGPPKWHSQMWTCSIQEEFFHGEGF